MSNTTKIQLQTASILKVPIHTYEKFTFIVNGELFVTTRLIADLLSSKISQIHQIDPTVSEYIINTHHKGDFGTFLKFVQFEETEINKDEIDFIHEVISELRSGPFRARFSSEFSTITQDNVFSVIEESSKYEGIEGAASKRDEAIEYFALHFGEMFEGRKDEINRADYDTLESVLKHPKLRVKDEDQLLHFINTLYLRDNEFSSLYSYVIFTNVGKKTIEEFVEIFDVNDMNAFVWKSIVDRLMNEIKTKEETNKERYGTQISREDKEDRSSGISFSYNENENFNGIISYLVNKSNNNIENEINITSTTARNSSDVAKNVTIFEKDDKYFYSINEKNAWLCFDFKEHKIIPTNYTIKSVNSRYNLKSWVLEGSNDQVSWEKIDVHNNFPGLKQHFQTCTFSVQYRLNKPCRYIRLRQTAPNCGGDHDLIIGSFELYGTFL